MSNNMHVRRLTISLEPVVYAKLPKAGKSGYINLILKQYYQKEAADQLYEYTKQKLMRDKDMNDWIVATVQEMIN